MTALTKQQITTLPIDQIQVEDRLRGVSQHAVDTLIVSIRELGHILHPFQVQKIVGGYRLLDGMHRLAAAKTLELLEVPVSVFTCTNHQAMKVEVEGNLAGAPLNALDMGLFLATQKRLYEEEHPEAKLGAKARAVANGDCTDKMSVQSFAANAADVLGKDERSIRRLVKAASDLTKDEIGLLRSANKKVRLNDLEFLGKQSDRSGRRAICEILAAGSANNAKAALDAHKAVGQPKIDRPADKQLRKLTDAYARASKGVRRQFVDDHREELLGLLAEQDAPDGIVAQFGSRRGAA